MDHTTLTNQLYAIMLDAAILGGPPLIAATLLGFMVSVLQTITQIQDQTLPQTVKITAIGFVLLFLGSSLAAPLFQASELLFTDFPKWIE